MELLVIFRSKQWVLVNKTYQHFIRDDWRNAILIFFFCILISVKYKNKWVGEQETIQVHMGQQQTQRRGKEFIECYL